MIEVSHLTRRFGSLVAVDDVSFSLEPGEVVGFLGPNGAGKTTSMRILTGYLAATSADVLRVAGYDVLRDSLKVRQNIGYLPESVPLYKEMRVEEMMAFQGRLHGMGRKQLMGRVPEVLERVGVLGRKRQLVGHLSRGLRQRVGLAVALLPNPKVLILDEPTSGLDPLQRAEVRTLIRELAGEHTVLLSSHILAEVESMSDRVIILREGRVVADGAREELIATLGGRGHVRLEAVVGDAEAARDLLATLPGVEDVQITERVGIHDGFTLSGSGDLREDVGALAAMKGWALRELSEVRPTLESLFASLVVGDGSIAPAPRPAPAPAPVSLSVEPVILDGSSGMGLDLMPLAPAVEAPSLGTPGQKDNFYSLNPFDGGGSRDLSKPVGSGDTQDEGCEDEEDEA